MNNKIQKIIQIILGLILIIFGANKFIGFMPPPELPEAAASFMGALVKTEYMFPFIGIVEVIIGLLLVFNKWVAFALILLAPVAVNMILFHLKLAPGGIGPAALVTILNVVLIYVNWNKYKPLFK
ncbi:MAG: DoxX family membrane protein [Flavobacteriaceae bacterium]|nr:DoxX family membrane protein [Flavobacteriaceae bacterium]